MVLLHVLSKNTLTCDQQKSCVRESGTYGLVLRVIVLPHPVSLLSSWAV